MRTANPLLSHTNYKENHFTFTLDIDLTHFNINFTKKKLVVILTGIFMYITGP